MCLENIQDLDTLFKEWRKKHESEERGTRYTDTFPYKKDYTCSDDFNKSFCCDGFIEYNKDYEKTILFIFREANISDKLKGKELHPETDYNYFHMKKEWENHLRNKIESKYTKFISYWLKKLNLDKCNIAYMNLNKRGGFDLTNFVHLKHYVAKYRCYILKEIEIINPYIIVCGGKRGTLNNLSIKHEKIINDYHPASSRHNSDINDQLRMLELQ